MSSEAAVFLFYTKRRLVLKIIWQIAGKSSGCTVLRNFGVLKLAPPKVFRFYVFIL